MSTITDATAGRPWPNDTGEHHVIDILDAPPAQAARVAGVTSLRSPRRGLRPPPGRTPA